MRPRSLSADHPQSRLISIPTWRIHPEYPAMNTPSAAARPE